ncbi:MAG TPA: hypothetical protein VKJ67_06160 [Methylomirabilota bacterium]|nr:hypothetical protein [Methylomirabilota bacterium]
MASSRRKLATAIVPVLALLGTLLLPGPARAQLAEGDERVSSDPKVIGRQIRAALALGQLSIQRLQSPQALDELDQTHKMMDHMYRIVRFAVYGLTERKDITKNMDPMVDFELSKTTLAWNTIRRPVDKYFNSIPPAEWALGATEDLQKAMSALRVVEALVP